MPHIEIDICKKVTYFRNYSKYFIQTLLFWIWISCFIIFWYKIFPTWIFKWITWFTKIQNKCSLRGFKHCHLGKHSRLLSHHIRIQECCECGYSVFLSEDGRIDRTTHAIGLDKYVRWKEREISEESYRPVATSAFSLKFTFGRLGVFLQIASHLF